MQQADVRLIIEGGALAPGILRVLTDSDEGKLTEVSARVEQLAEVIWMMVDSLQVDWVDPQQGVRAAITALKHIETSVKDIAAITGGFARKDMA